jgi:hypothetical protein
MLEFLQDIAHSLSPAHRPALTKPVEGQLLSFAPEDWATEVSRLETTFALWAVELLPAWGYPNPGCDPLVYVPEADVPGVSDQGCPATHRVEFHDSFAVFVHQATDFYARVVPLRELVAGVLARARSWLPSVGRPVPDPGEAVIPSTKPTGVIRDPPFLALWFRKWHRHTLMAVLLPLPLPRPKTKKSPWLRDAIVRWTEATARCVVARQHMADLHRQRRALRQMAWPQRAVTPVQPKHRKQVAWCRVRRALRRPGCQEADREPTALNVVLQRRYWWILRARVLKQRIHLFRRLRHAMAPVEGIKHYVDAFVGAEAALCSKFVHMGTVAGMRLLRHALACGSPRQFLREFVRTEQLQQTVPGHQCRGCKQNLLDAAVVCRKCDATYCSAACRLADHRTIRNVVCFDAHDEHAPILRTNVLRRLALYVKGELLRDAQPLARRLSLDHRHRSAADGIISMMIAVVGAQSSRALQAPPPPAVVGLSLVRRLEGAVAFGELVVQLRPRIRGDDWIETLIAASSNLNTLGHRLHSRRATRAVMAACFAERLVITGVGAQPIRAPFWRRNDPDAHDALQLVIPSKIRVKMCIARQTLWNLHAPELTGGLYGPTWPGGELFEVAGEAEHPILQPMDSRRGYGALHTLIRQLVVLEYDDAPGNDEMAIAMSAQLHDPLADDGGHPLLRDMILSLRQQMGLRYHDREAMSMLRTAMMPTAMRAQLQAAASQRLLARALTGTLHPTLGSQSARPFVANAMEEMDLQPRAVFGVLRTALYATGHSREQTARVLATTAVSLPGIGDHGDKGEPEEDRVRKLAAEILVMEGMWPSVRCWKHIPARRTAFWLLGDWYETCRHARNNDDRILELILSDRCATDTEQFGDKTPPVLDDLVVRGEW